MIPKKALLFVICFLLKVLLTKVTLINNVDRININEYIMKAFFGFPQIILRFILQTTNLIAAR